MLWIIFILILCLIIVDGSYGNRSPRSMLVGFQLEKPNENDEAASACDAVKKINVFAENSVAYMYFYTQYIDIPLLFLKYEALPYKYFGECIELEESDNKLIKNLYGENYIVFRTGTIDFCSLPAGAGDVLIFNGGPFVLLDYVMPGQNINRNNLQKNTYLKIKEAARNEIKISIPHFGIKGDYFYGVMVY